MISCRATKWPCEHRNETLYVCFDEAGSPRAGIGPKGGTARAISWQALVNIRNILHSALKRYFISQRYEE